MDGQDRIRLRQRRLLRLLARERADGILVTKPVNVTYLSGFTGEDSALLLAPGETILLTDPRFAEQAGQETQGIRIVVRRKGLMAAASQVVRRAGLGRLAVEASALSMADGEELRKRLRGCEMVLTRGLVERLRMIKDRRELTAIRRAIRIAEEAFRRTVRELRRGMTERQAAARLERHMLELGAEGPAFPTIVAAGERASLPHARPTDRPMRGGEAVLFDWGARWRMYHSDLTRMVLVDRIPAYSEKILLLTRAAQARAIAVVRPGRRASAVDSAARTYLKAHRHAKHFGHGLGHGVGLEVHEAPGIRPQSVETLRAGMVFTVEPGIYLPGRCGMRIEDVVLVTRKGHSLLSSLPRTPFVVRS